MEARITTIVLALLAMSYIWIRQGKKEKRGYLALATIYFILVIMFNVLAGICSCGFLPEITAQTLNFISQAVRLVGIISVAIYAGVPRRSFNGMV